MKLKWNQIGGQLGLGVAILGGLLIFLGWNGAASYNFVPAQFPYLISGGLAGLALVIVGAALIVVDNQRRDRAQLQGALRELQQAVERLATAAMGTTGNGHSDRMAEAEAAGLVAIGGNSYHRPSCRLLEGRGALPTLAVEAAQDRGLSPCRVCEPAAGELEAQYAAPSTSRRRRSRQGS